ncbi:MAG: hypothetical protein ACK5LX_00585 [Oscillospiraceae bacterium]
MLDNRPDKKQAAVILQDEINDMMLRLRKAETILNDIATKYFGKAKVPEGWALENEYSKYSTKVEIVADYLWELKEMISGLEATSEERSADNG